MSDESGNVIFFEMVNGTGTSTLHMTFRSQPNENEADFYNRVRLFMQWADPGADVNFKLKDQPRPSFQRGGGKPGGKVEIKGDGFVIKTVTRFEKPHKEAGKPAWSYLRATGEQDGETVSVDCFVGNPGWQKPQNPVTMNATIPDLFPNFWQWVVDAPKDATLLRIMAKVKKNEQYHNYDLVDIVPV